MKYMLFTAPWCAPCRNLKKSLPENAMDDVQEVNVDTQKDLVEKYSVRSIPTLIRVDEDGVEDERITGTMAPNTFIDFIV